MKYASLEQMITSARAAITRACEMLHDSPLSRHMSVFETVGFVKGYCRAMDWEEPADFWVWADGMAGKGK